MKIKVQIEIGATLKKSHLAMMAEMYIAPRIGEMISVLNNAMRVVDVLHHLYEQEEAVMLIVVTSGNDQKDSEILDRARRSASA